MAVLSAGDRNALMADLMRTADCPGGVTKADLIAAVNAADSWADTNAAAFNTALPLPARTALTAKQKAALLMWVISRRYLVA